MKKVVIALLTVVVLSLALTTPVLADPSDPPGQSAFGHEHGMLGGDTVADIFSNYHQGWKSAPPAWGPGGAPHNYQ